MARLAPGLDLFEGLLVAEDRMHLHLQLDQPGLQLRVAGVGELPVDSTEFIVDRRGTRFELVKECSDFIHSVAPMRFAAGRKGGGLYYLKKVQLGLSPVAAALDSGRQRHDNRADTLYFGHCGL